MHPHYAHLLRRDFLTSTASGIGALALETQLQKDGLLANEGRPRPLLAPRPGHFLARAKHCIFVFLAGAPSQIDLLDPKPLLVKHHGEPLPDTLGEGARFAFISKKTARLKGSPRTFSQCGESGTEFSDLLPWISRSADDIAVVRSMHTDEFNHHPAQLMMSTGVGRLGRPSIGAWINYGLGSPAENLPGYVVLSAGAGASGGSSNWSSGFLPSVYRGTVFRNQGEPILNLSNPPGVATGDQQRSLQAITTLNKIRLQATQDPEIANRVSSYELAFRMQTAAPELVDLSDESEGTLRDYGVDRKEPENQRHRGYTPNAHAAFGRNCLLARRLVERGVRFINIIHASWDHHDALQKDLSYNCSVVDQPIGALLRDLKQRGLLDDTLVVVSGEFGRTPLEDAHEGKGQEPGRDHHPFAFSSLLAGGGVRGGQVIGATDELGWAPVADPVHINDFHATLLHLFGLNHLKLARRFGGFDIRLTNVGGRVVEKVFTG
ncbi:MAG: sulfatase [Planctomycetaceae bacterium]|nr:sulfatase [Planctomycetaceae bacterium]